MMQYHAILTAAVRMGSQRRSAAGIYGAANTLLDSWTNAATAVRSFPPPFCSQPVRAARLAVGPSYFFPSFSAVRVRHTLGSFCRRTIPFNF